MTRRLSPAELDQQDAMTALRLPPTPQRMDPRGKVISELQAKVSRQREQNKALNELVQSLRDDKRLLLLDLHTMRAERDRLRAMARAANDTERQA